MGGPLIILIDYMIFMSPFLDASRMSIETVFFLVKLDPGMVSLQNAFLNGFPSLLLKSKGERL